MVDITLGGCRSLSSCFAFYQFCWCRIFYGFLKFIYLFLFYYNYFYLFIFFILIFLFFGSICLSSKKLSMCPSNLVCVVQVDHGQRHILTACQDRNIRVYNVTSGKHSKTFKGSIGDDGTLIKVCNSSSCGGKVMYIIIINHYKTIAGFRSFPLFPQFFSV